MAVAIFAVALVGNLLILAALWNYPPLRRLSNVSIASLSVANILNTMVDFLFRGPASRHLAIVQTYQSMPENLQMFCMGLQLAVSLVPAFHAIAIASQRYCAIVHPFKYAQKFTVKRVVVFIGLVWLSAIILPLIPATISALATRSKNQAVQNWLWQNFWYYTSITMGTIYFCACAEMIWLYVQIARTTRKSRRALRQHNNITSRPGNKTMRRSYKIATGIVTVYVLSGTPVIITFLTYQIAGSLVSHHIHMYVEKLSMSSAAAVSPFIYAWISQEFKTAYKYILIKILCRHTPQNTSLKVQTIL